MKQYVIGVDLSTKRIDAALLPLSGNGTVSVCTSIVAATTLGDAARIREVHSAALDAFSKLRAVAERDGRVALVAVEQPAAGGQPAILAQLAPVYGAVVAAVARGEHVVGVRVSEWRHVLGLRARPPADVTAGLTARVAQSARKQWLKQQSVAEASRLLAESGHAVPLDTHDAAEALLVAYAARLIYAAEDAA